MSTADEAIKAAPPETGRRLLKRKLPQVVHHLRAVEPEEEAAARRAVADAREALAIASYRVDDKAAEVIEAAQAELDQKRAALAACYEPVAITAMPPAEFEEFVKGHPPRDGHDEPYNPLTLNPELFLACVQGDYTREEWETGIIPQLSKGEWTGLQIDCVAVNGRTSDGAIPKD